jgi:hypothetical protein
VPAVKKTSCRHRKDASQVEFCDALGDFVNLTPCLMILCPGVAGATCPLCHEPSESLRARINARRALECGTSVPLSDFQRPNQSGAEAPQSKALRASLWEESVKRT